MFQKRFEENKAQIEKMKAEDAAHAKWCKEYSEAAKERTKAAKAAYAKARRHKEAADAKAAGK